MCPFCFASVGLIVAGTVSTGGLAAITAKVLSNKIHGSRNKQNK